VGWTPNTSRSGPLFEQPLRKRVADAIGRYKRVIGDALRSRSDQTEATEIAIAAAALNRMLEFGRPNYVRIAQTQTGLGVTTFVRPIPCNTVMPARRGTPGGNDTTGGKMWFDTVSRRRP
jgi:hypothetical protein